LGSLIAVTIFTVPFVLIGIAIVGVGIRDRNVLAILLGGAFAGFPLAGPLKDWLNIGKSQERLTAGLRSNLLRSPEPPAPPDGPTGYRTLARVERTEIITLAKLPLRHVPHAPGKKLSHGLSATGVTVELLVIHAFLLVFGFSVVAQVAALFKQQSVIQVLGIVCFALATLLLHFFAQNTRREARLRPSVELSVEPATLGEMLDIHVRVAGHLQTTLLDIAIVCEEIATDSTGDGSTTHTEELHREKLWSGPVRGAAFSKDARVTLPERGIPSFDLGSNGVAWSVEIGIQEPDGGWTKRQVPFRVLPKAPPGVELTHGADET